MTNNQTIDQLKSMRMFAMANLHLEQLKLGSQSSYTSDEYLALLTQREWDEKQNNKSKRLIKNAKFRQQATLEDVDFTTNRGLDKNNMDRLSTLDFMTKRENLIITGPSGVGKSYIAQALGFAACNRHFKVMYMNTSRLFKKLKLAKMDGSYLTQLKKIESTDLLILDDFGLQKLDNMARESLMDIIDDRYDKKSTIVASQIPVSTWYDLIGESTIADAILDRLVHSSHRINLIGESLRKNKLA